MIESHRADAFKGYVWIKNWYNIVFFLWKKAANKSIK